MAQLQELDFNLSKIELSGLSSIKTRDFPVHDTCHEGIKCDRSSLGKRAVGEY